MTTTEIPSAPTAAERATARPARAGVRRRRHGGLLAPFRAVSDWLDRPLASFHLLLAVFVLMLGMGLLMVLSSSAATAYQRSDSAFAVFTNQATFAVLGLIAFFFVTKMPLQVLRTMSTAAILVALALLVAVLIPGIGSQWNGARSWITLGSSIQFQPSEVAKLALLLWAANVMASVRTPYRRLRSLLIPVGPVFVLMVGLVMLQPDLGTTVTLAIVFFAVLYFAGAQLWFFGAVAGLGVAGVIFLATSAGYRMDRVTAWLHPDRVDPEYTYQAFQGLYALGSGGLWGVGIGQSKMKWGRLPNADSDFIFAIIGEELGLIGTLTVILLFAVLAYTGLRIARRNVDPFIKIVAASATVWLVGQAAINISYVVGLLPVTGIPLPMFSAGGTSLVVTMVVFGLLANFARREPQAAAALHGPGRRGMAAFFGIGNPPSGAKPSKRAAKVRQRRQVQRNAARSTAHHDEGSVQRHRTRRPAPAHTARRPDGRTSQKQMPERASAGRRVPLAARRGGQRQTQQLPPAERRTAAQARPRRSRHRIRRAFGFPTPEDRRRQARPGRTIVP